jgi:superfamily I DNA/RNA helicase
LTRQSEWPTSSENVAISTIHSAKGLEFDHVLLPGLNQELTPHGPEDGDGSLEGWRRLFAMGVGRARRSVMVGTKPGEQSTLIGMLSADTYELVDLS